MAEEGVLTSSPSDLKRKLEDIEPEAPLPPTCPVPEEHDDQETALVKDSPPSPDVKRPRLEDDTSVAGENGRLDKNADEPSNGNKVQENVENGGADDVEKHSNDVENTSDVLEPAVESNTVIYSEALVVEGSKINRVDEISKEEGEPPSGNVSQEGDGSAQKPEDPVTESGTISRKIEVPNNKVGVLIGKGGDTVCFLQYNSGAKIQIVRDADADLASSMRPVELIGSLESINKAEKLIRDVIQEADAGGSPALIARGFVIGQTSGGAAEQLEMKVPNEKVGLIIGKGGETIKNLQTRSGARIQLIPQQTGGSDESKERTIRVTGHKTQIDIAVEMIQHVMRQLPKPSYVSGSYHQPAYQTRGPPPAQWGPPRGSPYSSHPMMGYDYQQQRGGHYPSQNAQYPSSYYPPAPPQAAPRQSGYGFGWEQRPPHGGSSYDFYGGHGPARAPGPHTGAPAHGQGSGLQPNYHYGQSTQGPPPEYGHAGPYPSQPIPSHQGYGHSGYENAAPPHSYGSSQPAYPPTAAPQSGYYTQQQYGKPPPTASYGMNTQYPPQSYGNPRANQQGGGDAMAMYHSGSSNQMYGSQQQVYPSTYTAASEPPPVQQQQQQQQQPTTYPMYSTDNQGQGRVATYGSYPYSAPTAGYPITDQQAAAYHHQAASAAAPQDPAATAAATAYMQQQQQVMGYTEQPSTAHATYAQTDSATQQVYGAPPAAH